MNVFLCVVYVPRSVLRDKAVVQGAIKMLQEEVGALKSTNTELQNQLCLVSTSAWCIAHAGNLELQATCLHVCVYLLVYSGH